MATSGSTSWELTRDQLITASIRKLIGGNTTPDSTQLSEAQTALNGIVTRFSTLGMPLWKRTETSVSLVAGTNSYTITGALRIGQVLSRYSTTEQTELDVMTLYDFNQLPLNAEGPPTSYCVLPTVTENSTIRIWPTPDSDVASDYSLQVVYHDELDTFTSSGETPDFPSYWTDALVWELAVVLSPEYGVPLMDRQFLERKAKEYLDQALSFSYDESSLYFQPNTER